MALKDYLWDKLWNSLNIGLLVFLLLTITVEYCNAESAFFKLSPRYNIYNDPELEPGYGIEAQVGYENIFIFGSYDNSMLRLHGQRSGSFKIYGAGIGIKIPLVEKTKYSLNLSGELGYYYPKSSLPDRIVPTPGFPDGYHEGLFYECRSRYMELGIDYFGYDPFENGDITGFNYKIDPAPGGSINLDFTRRIINNLMVAINIGYRYVKFPETFYASGYPNSTGEWKHNYLMWAGERDFSGVIAGLSISYRF